MVEIFNLLFTAFDQIRQIALGKKTFSESERKQLFESTIESSFLNLKEVHSDYCKSFKNLLENIRNQVNPVETVRIFKASSLNKVADRIELKTFSKEVVEVERMRYLNSKELQLFCEYARAIDDYFHSANSSSNVSWYSAFINEFKNEIDKGQNPFELKEYKTIGGGMDCLFHVEKKIEDVLFLELPKSWEDVCTSYNKLKLEWR